MHGTPYDRPPRTTRAPNRYEPDPRSTARRDRAVDRAHKVRKAPKRTASASALEECEVEDVPQKRDPEEPGEQTQVQIDFLNHFSERCPGCAYEAAEFAPLPEDTTPEEERAFTKGGEGSVPYRGQGSPFFESFDAADAAVRAILRSLKPANAAKPQQCSAYSIMSTAEGFMIVQTNSVHNNASVKLENGTVRPVVEPMLSTELQTVGAQGTGPRFYAVVSCSFCEPTGDEGELIYPVIDPNDQELNKHAMELAQKWFPDDGIAQQRTLAEIGSAINRLRRRFSLLKMDRIQPNENPQTVQSGGSLHHSEMEATYFARRNGFTIHKMYIDRDCCKVCAATLGKVDPDIHGNIELINWSEI